jgi:predicted nucleic-acid-binding protein
MIGVDSNVLLRHILQDDAIQAAAAARFLEDRGPSDPAFVSRVVLVETLWVLERTHRIDAAHRSRIVRALLASRDVLLEGAASIRRALEDAEESNADLADAIIAHTAIDAGCDGAVTFDRRAQRLPGMLPVN